jgi:hypothetical protein
MANLSLRAVNALVVRTYLAPDEYFQALEPAHLAVFRSGELPWEYADARVPLRSWLCALPSAVALIVIRLIFGHSAGPRSKLAAPRLAHSSLAARADASEHCGLVAKELGGASMHASLPLRDSPTLPSLLAPTLACMLAPPNSLATRPQCSLAPTCSSRGLRVMCLCAPHLAALVRASLALLWHTGPGRHPNMRDGQASPSHPCLLRSLVPYTLLQLCRGPYSCSSDSLVSVADNCSRTSLSLFPLLFFHLCVHLALTTVNC